MSITRINSLGITDGTIVNGDINASAAIASTKLTGVNDAKAWVNFNGTGTVAIRGSFNVSSITDDGTGLYTVNFTNALADANYVVVTCNNTNDGGSDHRQQLYVNGSGGNVYSLATSSVQLEFTTVDLNGYSRQDSAMVAIAIFR